MIKITWPIATAWAHGRREEGKSLKYDQAKLTTIGNNNGSYRGILV